MAEGIADCMPLALRSVGDAIRLDSENKTKEAYCQYLSCMIYISQVLKDDAWDKDLRQVYNSDTAKLFRLLQQCQERALTIISSIASGASTSHKPEAQKAQGAQRRYSDSNTVNASQSDHSHDHLAHQHGATSKLSADSASPGSTLSAPSTDGYLHLPSPPGSPMLRHRRTGSYDPLEKAYQENKQLIAAYRERMQNSNKGRRNQDVMQRNLGLMRRMSENLVIAKAREQAIKKKLLERQRRLQEETNRRFGPAVLSTKEQQDQRILYLKILEFEQETVWPKHLRERLQLMPTDAKLIKEIITKIFSSADHPLTQFLLQYQYYVHRKLAPLVKDVGFPDVKSGGIASSKESNIVSSEVHHDQQKPTPVIDSEHVYEGDRANQEHSTSALRQADEDTKKPSSESIAKETVNESNKAVEDKCDEEGDGSHRDHEVALDVDLKKGPSEYGSEGKKSSIDLATLKNLLDKETSSDTAQTEDAQLDESKNGPNASVLEETDESTDLESYFQDLEDEMFGWESSGEENGGKEKESIFADNRREITDEESHDYENEEASSGKIAESRTENLDESTDINNEASSSQFDSSEVRNETSPEQSNIDVTHEPDQIEQTDTEPHADFDADMDKQVKQPTEDTNPLETNDFILRQEEQCTGDRTSSKDSNDEGEAQQMEPNTNEAAHKISSNDEALQTPDGLHERDEGKEGEEGVKDKEHTQMPELPLLEERSSKTKQDVPIVPPTDEVRKQLKDIFVDVRFFLEKLQKLLILAYEPLDTAAGRDLCYSFLEFPFFKPLWPMLLAVLRQVNYEKEITLADVMSTHISKGPLELGVAQRLCMEDQEVLDSTGNNYPYQLAVEELHKVVTLFCPLEKLECLVRTSRCICQCVEDYWENTGKPRHSPETAIGCDDLLPILSFVVIRSGMAQLVSECDAMEEFIPEGYLMGEEGYCLTTLITALAYLATLKPT